MLSRGVALFASLQWKKEFQGAHERSGKMGKYKGKDMWLLAMVETNGPRLF